MWRLLKGLLISITALLGFIVLAALVILQMPSLIVNENNLRKILPYLPIQMSWRNGELRASSESFLTKGIYLNFENLCIRVEPTFNGCWDRLELDTTVRLNGIPPQLGRIQVLNSEGTQLHIRTGAPKEETRKPKKESGFSVVRWLRGLRWDQVHVDLEELSIKNSKTAISIEGDLSGQGRGDNLDLTAQASVRIESAGQSSRKQPITIQSELKLGSQLPFLETAWKADFKTDLSLPKEGFVQVSGKAQGQGMSAKYDISGRFQQKTLDFVLNLSGDADTEKIQAHVAGYLGFPKQLVGFEKATPCFVEARMSGQYHVDCPFRLQVPRMKSVPVRLPVEVTATFRSQFTNEFPIDIDKRFEGRARLELDESQTDLFKAFGDLESEFSFVIGALPQFEKLNLTSSVTARMPEFQRLVTRLKGSPYALPAPLLVLKGPVEVKVIKANLKPEHSIIPFEVTTRLSAPQQILNLTSRGELQMRVSKKKLQPELRVEVDLNQVRLVLPRMDLRAPPRLIPDSRIKEEFSVTKAERGRKKKRSFKYQVQVRTIGPFELVSNLAQRPIPIQFQIVASSDSPPKGQVHVREFPVRLFRRRAQLDYFRLSLAPKDNTVDGKFTVKYTDYTIFLRIEGQMEKPQLSFWSNPPLPEDQLIAVLVFGRELNELEPEARGSVGSVRGAIADRALGLASMYYLASTPIESMGYDPTTGAVTAKIRLQEGTSLNVGLEEDEVSGIGVRRRLGGNWYLNTEVEDPMESGVRTVSTFLEWIFRY